MLNIERMVEHVKVVIANYTTRGRNFVVVTDLENGDYFAIEDCYITNGRLNKKLNGLQLHMQPTLDLCLKTVDETVYFEELKNKGYSTAKAFSIVHKIPLEVAEMAFGKV